MTLTLCGRQAHNNDLATTLILPPPLPLAPAPSSSSLSLSKFLSLCPTFFQKTLNPKNFNPTPALTPYLTLY